MLIRSTSNLHYPITVKSFLIQAGEQVKRYQPLFRYTYTSTVTEGNKYGDEKQVEKSFPAEFKSETEGTFISWQIKEGQVLQGPGLALVNIEEPCTHEETFGNLCVVCGVDVTQLDNSLTSVPNSERATVNTAHGNNALKVSHRLASKRSEEATRRLLDSRKLSLVVDLDQTIIQATVDSTIALWQKDPENPNYDAVKDLPSFQLSDDGPGARPYWYYIKQRPGLKEFLETIAQKYELHIYTMGTRAYAQNIAKIVDPDQKYFGDRILSRDESGSLTSKSLQRLFPVNTDMVVIIDDRGDVWSWSPNLIKVTAYDFFVGIGDINSSFLPKVQGAVTAAKPVEVKAPEPATNGTSEASSESPEEVASKANGDAPADEPPAEAPSVLEAQLVAMAGGDSDAVIEAQAVAQSQVIAAQLEEQPLLKKQEMLDKLDESENNADSNDHAAHRHNLLRDDDDELRYLQANLEDVHRVFFEEYDRERKTLPTGRVAELKGEKSSPTKKTSIDDLSIVPDVKDIMPAMKEQVLQGVVICFTGVIPQGIDHAKSDIGMWAQSFGARINANLTKSTTHVIAHKDRKTHKVRQAAQHPKIQIVLVSWLLECFTQWKHVEEEPHILEFERESGQQEALPFDDLEDQAALLTPSEDGSEKGELPDDEDAELFSPTSFEGNNIDWNDMDKEFEDFMGSDMDSDIDEGTESDASNSSNKSGKSSGSRSSKKSKKRKRTTESVDGDEKDAEEQPEGEVLGSDLQKRKKRAIDRGGTGLANVTVAESSGLPSPETTGPEEEVVDKANGGTAAEAEDMDEDDEDDAFTKEFMEAMESPSDDEEEVAAAAA